MRTCQTRDEAILLVQGSSTVYPFIKVRSYKGRRMLDGKFALLSPIAALHDCDRIEECDWFTKNIPHTLREVLIRNSQE